MRAFISYSLNDSEQFVLTILARKLKEQGFIVSSSYNLFSSNLNYETFTQLNKSNLFIGLITHTGNANDRVLNEWRQANLNQIPSLLLVENNVRFNPPITQNPNVVVFDRNNPTPSIELVRSKISLSNPSLPTNINKDNTMAWLLGGLAVIAIIGLLAKDK